MAKKMIKLITAVGDVVNKDPDVGDLLKVTMLASVEHILHNAQSLLGCSHLDIVSGLAACAVSHWGRLISHKNREHLHVHSGI